jgi:proline iminopeptidase
MNHVTEQGLPPVKLHTLYPANELGASAWLDVGAPHRLWYGISGAPDGLPVVILHGGPASGSSPAHRRFFDPSRYRIIQFDQRGCGRSVPLGSSEGNTTTELVADIERLRQHLGVARWLVVGGSWGASLGLAYAAAHRASCLGLLLRGSFLTGDADMAWFLGSAAALRPTEWARLCALPDLHQKSAPNELLDAYAMAFGPEQSAPGPLAKQALLQWIGWETALGQAGHAPEPALSMPDELMPTLLAKYRLQLHYLRQQCFLGEANLLACAAQLGELPGAILHGQLDLVCCPRNAWALKQVWPQSQLLWVAHASHDPFGPDMASAMVACTTHFAQHGRFPQALPPADAEAPVPPSPNKTHP